ncbi:MAG: hypothetical protein H0X64_07055 [Gemmatimonadaceae bacterium]|nr:hypothetical protein [Gemmatimonadaceae bacterium]
MAKFAIMAACSAALAGCSPDQSLVPQPSDGPGHPGVLRQSAAAGAGAIDTISVTAEDGVKYTLSTLSLRLTTSDGHVVAVSPLQAQSLATSFLAMQEGKAAADSLARKGGDMPPLLEPYTVTPGSPRPGGRPAYRIRTGGRPAADSGDPSSGPVSTFGLDVCTDIEVAVFNGTKDWNTSRDSWSAALKGLVQMAIAAAAGGDFPHLPTAGRQVAAFDVYSYEMMTSRTGLNVLATLYKSQGCWNTHWVSPGANYSGISALGSLTLVCTYKTVYVSINGGGWKAVAYTECEYKVYTQ